MHTSSQYCSRQPSVANLHQKLIGVGDSDCRERFARSKCAKSPVRLRKSLAVLAGALLFVILSVGGANAQTFGSLSGTITDSSSALVPNATVTVTNAATGYLRSTKTNSAGFYTFPDLLAGTYGIRVDANGFESQVTQRVKLDAAAPASVSFKLHIGNVKEAVQVEAVAPELDRTSSSIGDTFSEQQVDNLPINGRDFGRYELLAPGAVLRSAYIYDITFDGLTSEDGYFYLDGVDTTRVDYPYWANGSERGARLMTGSAETVAEFRVQANGYQAEYGRSAGGIVNIVSKSGSDHWHGEAFEFNRNESYDARNFFARTGPKPLFRFNDYGGNLGGPVLGKNTFIFANYEGNVQNIGAIDQVTVLSAASRASALSAHPELAPLVADIPIGVDSTVNPLYANAFLTGTNNVNENTGSFRIDHNFSQKDSMFGRYNFNESTVSGPLFVIASAFDGVNAKQNVPTGITNIAIHEQHIFGPRLINDALVGFQRVAETLNQAEPIPLTLILDLSGYSGGIGQSKTHADVFQYGDAMTMVLHNHTMKWGGTYWRTQDDYSSSGYNEILYLNTTNFINNSAFEVIELAGNPGSHARASEWGMYVQDNWQVTPKLALNYGLRWDVATTPHDAQYTGRSYNTQSGTLFPAGHQYYPVNLSNFGPRLGVAYSPTPRTVVRAGAGLFYRDFPIANAATNIPVNTLPTNLTLTQAANPGLKYPFTGFANGSSAIQTVYGFPATKPDLYSLQYNLGAQQELTRGLSAQIAYIGLHAVNLDRVADINLYNQGTTVRPNPNFGDIYLYEGNGFESYNGLQTILKAHLGQLTADLNYAYSHAIDNACDLGLAGNEPQDYNNIRAERASGCQDVRQNFKYNLLYKIPVGTGFGLLGSSSTPVRALVSGWSINSLGIMHSGLPQNVTYGTNTYGNGDTINQRPNLVAGQSLYLPKAISPTSGYVNYWNVNAWTKPATGTFGNSPRNPVFGPHFTQVDASLVKTTPVYKDQALEFRVEMFNIFNHPNFAAPNAVWAPGSISFGEITSTFGNTLGFGAARQLELALKYKF